MIKFFRKIRQNLLLEGKTGKYFKYAIGEIVLVVVGILIALQLDTWNDNRKYAQDKIEFLNGMRNELTRDITFADTLITWYQKRLSYFNMVDTSYHLHDLDIVPLADSSDVLDYRKLMQRLIPFKPNNATYQSFMTYGSMKIIKNKELLLNLQKYYANIQDFHSTVYENIINIEFNLNWNRAYEKKYKPYKTINDLNDKQFIAELSYFFDTMHGYLALLFYVKDKANELIDDIDKELNNTVSSEIAPPSLESPE